MFGVYEVEYEGRRYFGNVLLRELHLFDYESNFYLVNVGSMAFRPVSKRLAALIGGAAASFGGLIPQSLMVELRELELIAGEETSPPEGKPGESLEKAEYPVTSISLFLSQKCNMRCVYCYGDGGEYSGKGMMGEETAFGAVDWLLANSRSEEKVSITFFGGEPLLNFPLMKKITHYARERAAEKGKQVTFDIVTNGSLLNDEVISFLKDEKVAPMISFDGPPEYQNRQRPFKNGGGSYDQVHANVRRLQAVFPHLPARATVYGDADPFRIREGLEQAGFKTCLLVKASPVLLNAQGADIPPDELSERTFQRMVAYRRKEAHELLAAIQERKIVKGGLPGLLPVIAGMDLGVRRFYACGVGKSIAGISIGGDIYPCHRFVGQKEMRIGNIADYTVEGLNDYHRAVVDHLPECRSCWARYLCGGGCFYHNKAITGDMHRPEALDCRERKAMFEGLVHVYCRLDKDDLEYLKALMSARCLSENCSEKSFHSVGAATSHIHGNP